MAPRSTKSKAAPQPEQPTMNLFGMAQVAETVQTSKAKKKERDVIELGEQYDAHQIVNYVIKSLTTVLKTIEAGVKSEAFEKFASVGFSLKRRPENFKAEGLLETDTGEKISGGTIMLNKRSTRSPLTEQELKLFVEAGISFEDYVDVAPVVQHYAINPKYFDDQELLGKMSAALAKIPGLPADVIQIVPGNPGVINKVTTETSIDEIFQLPESNPIRETLLKLASVMAIKGTTKVESMTQAFKLLADLGLDDLIAAEAKQTKTKK